MCTDGEQVGLNPQGREAKDGTHDPGHELYPWPAFRLHQVLQGETYDSNNPTRERQITGALTYCSV